MKKILIFTFALLVPLFLFGFAANLFALDLGGGFLKQGAEEAGYASDTSETTFAETLGLIVQIALSFVGIIFISLTVYAGYLWMIARGDESQIEKSQNIIRAAVIGLIITVGAYSISAFLVPVIIQKTAGDDATTGEVGGAGEEENDLVPCCWVCPTGSANCTTPVEAQPYETMDACDDACIPPDGSCLWKPEASCS